MGKQIESLVLNYNFWDQVAKVCKLYEFIYRVLRIVDTEVWPTLGVIFEAIKVMKEAIQLEGKSVNWVLKIINDRWVKTLEHPLHATGTI